MNATRHPLPGRTLLGLLALAAALTLPHLARAELTLELRKEILTREQARDLTDGFLVETAAHADPEVRARAIRALGRIQDPAALPTLAAGVTDAETPVRLEAAFALGQLFDEAATPVLEAALEDEKDPGVRRALVLGLGKSGAEATLPRLTGLLEDPELGPSAAEALGYLALAGIELEPAASALNGALRSGDPELVWRAAFAVQRGRCAGANAGLKRALKSEDPRARIFACRAIGALRQTKLGEEVLPLLEDPDWRVRVEALRALAATDNDYHVSRASLLLEDKVEHVRLTAIDTMGKLASGGGIARLRDYERSSDWRVRGAVLQAKAEATGEGALVDLREASRDPNWRIRLAAAQAFGAVKSEQGLLLLEPMILDEKPQVQAAAINSLVQYPQLEAVEYIREGLKSSDLAVLTTAANGVGQRLDRDALPLLLEAYRPLMSPVDTEVMTAILEATGIVLTAKDEDGAVGSYTAEDRKAAMELLAAAAQDTDLNVARQAAQSLALVRDETAEIAETPRFFEHFDADRFAALEASGAGARASIVTNKGTIVIELLPGEAPGTVENFVRLARGGFYNGLMFHRVVSDFVIQGGDPRGDGWGGPGYAIRCEYNPVPYATGTVGMALAGKDTGSSQFFITHSPQPHLNGRYTVFGRVVEGQEDVVDQIQVGDTIQEIRIEGI